jgi:hypothetical protein
MTEEYPNVVADGYASGERLIPFAFRVAAALAEKPGRLRVKEPPPFLAK